MGGLTQRLSNLYHHLTAFCLQNIHMMVMQAVVSHSV